MHRPRNNRRCSLLRRRRRRRRRRRATCRHHRVSCRRCSAYGASSPQRKAVDDALTERRRC